MEDGERSDNPLGGEARATDGHVEGPQRAGPTPGQSRPAGPALRGMLAELSRRGVLFLDDDGRVQYVDPAAARELGLEPGDIMGRRLDEMLPPERPGGGEDTLLVSPSELTAIFSDTPIMMMLVDRECRVRKVNRATLDFARRPTAAMVGLHSGEALGCLHALESPKGCGHGLFCQTCELRAAVKDTLRTANSHHRIEAHVTLGLRKQRGERHFLVSTIPLRQAAETVVLLCLEDISDRKQAEEALEESQRVLSTLLSNLPGMAYRCRNDEHWTMEFVSEGCTELTGHPPDSLLLNRDVSYAELIHAEDREPVRREVNAALRRRRPFELLYRIVTAAGEERWVWEKGRGVFAPDGELLALEGFIADITERRRAEQEREQMQGILLHAQKMEAVGILAGGIAHDFNNLLTVINGNTQLALMAVESGEPDLADCLMKILAASDTGANLVRQLLVFSRKEPVELMSLSLNKIIGDLFKMLGRLIGEDVVIDAQLFPRLWTVQGDETSMEQVLMNLAVNARDAMPDGGRLTIRTENVILDEKACALIPEARPGRFVRLTVADTGIGMEPDILQHIFEPFFSTKEPGQGSGLGLSVVYGVVKQHGGWITVASKPGKGARFTAHFPASFPRPEQKAREKTLLRELRGNGEHILLVEDENEVREFARRVLSKSGYQVTSAANAEEAEEAFAREAAQFDLVLSDVVLPGKTGIQLVERLMARQPGLPVLLTSGYADQKSQWPVVREKGYPFLQKPYTLVGLLRGAKDALGRPPDANGEENIE